MSLCVRVSVCLCGGSRFGRVNLGHSTISQQTGWNFSGSNPRQNCNWIITEPVSIKTFQISPITASLSSRNQHPPFNNHISNLIPVAFCQTTAPMGFKQAKKKSISNHYQISCTKTRIEWSRNDWKFIRDLNNENVLETTTRLTSVMQQREAKLVGHADVTGDTTENIQITSSYRVLNTRERCSKEWKTTLKQKTWVHIATIHSCSADQLKVVAKKEKYIYKYYR